jgi:hypothetical protein
MFYKHIISVVCMNASQSLAFCHLFGVCGIFDLDSRDGAWEFWAFVNTERDFLYFLIGKSIHEGTTG